MRRWYGTIILALLLAAPAFAATPVNMQGNSGTLVSPVWTPVAVTPEGFQKTQEQNPSHLYKLAQSPALNTRLWHVPGNGATPEIWMDSTAAYPVQGLTWIAVRITINIDPVRGTAATCDSVASALFAMKVWGNSYAGSDTSARGLWAVGPRSGTTTAAAPGVSDTVGTLGQPACNDSVVCRDEIPIAWQNTRVGDNCGQSVPGFGLATHVFSHTIWKVFQTFGAPYFAVGVRHVDTYLDFSFAPAVGTQEKPYAVSLDFFGGR